MMKIVDCFWEKRNLNCSAAEIVVDSKDSFCIDQFDFIQNYDYIVVNDDVDMAIKKIEKIVEAESLRPARNSLMIKKIIGGD